MSITLIDANPDEGFNYPYYFHVPDLAESDESIPILVEPTNMSRPTDSFEEVLSKAKERAASEFGRGVADRLSIPFLHPVFPRPFEEPVDWTHFTHSLDRESLKIRDSTLERIDLQLLNMVADAKNRLSEHGITVRDEFAMDGFSASGTFVNRFAALHPEKLLSVTAGGINGLAVLPISEVDTLSLNHPTDLTDILGSDTLELNYPVGIADLEAITGNPFDLEVFRSVNQFLYMGTDDQKDALLYPDAWTDPELRMAAILTYGEDIHDERFPTCKKIYDEAGASAVFRLYEDTGHTPEPALNDVIEFHKRSFAGDDIADIRSDIGGDQLE